MPMGAVLKAADRTTSDTEPQATADPQRSEDTASWPPRDSEAGVGPCAGSTPDPCTARSRENRTLGAHMTGRQADVTLLLTPTCHPLHSSGSAVPMTVYVPDTRSWGQCLHGFLRGWGP